MPRSRAWARSSRHVAGPRSLTIVRHPWQHHQMSDARTILVLFAMARPLPLLPPATTRLLAVHPPLTAAAIIALALARVPRPRPLPPARACLCLWPCACSGSLRLLLVAVRAIRDKSRVSLDAPITHHPPLTRGGGRGRRRGTRKSRPPAVSAPPAPCP
jgi:hypothetical protein